MGFKNAHGGAVVFGALGIILIIACLATTAWMTACMSYDNIIAATREAMEAAGQALPEGFEAGAKQLRGMQLCIHQGLFKVSIVVAGISVALGVSVASIPAHVVFAAIGLIAALACAFAAVILHCMAANAKGEEYENKTRTSQQTNRATVLFACAVLLSIGGMVSYTIGTAHVIHQPIPYMAQFGQSMMGAFEGMGGNGANGFGLGSQGRKRRQVEDTADAMKLLTKMVEGMDPVYGYSYIIGWVSVVISIIALGFTLVARRSGGSYDAANMKI